MMQKKKKKKILPKVAASGCEHLADGTKNAVNCFLRLEKIYRARPWWSQGEICTASWNICQGKVMREYAHFSRLVL